MVGNGVAALRSDGLPDLAGAQPLEGAGLDSHSIRAEVSEDVRGLGEEEVTGEDRDGVVPAGVGRRRTTAQVRLVHHIVVVERRKVSELDHHRGRHDTRRLGVAELRGQQDEQGAEALAAGVDEVPGGLRHEGVVTAHRSTQEVLHPIHPSSEPDLEGGIDHPQAHQRPRGMRAHG